MKTLHSSPNSPPPGPREEAPGDVIDTSRMSRGKREALEMTEAARDKSAGDKSLAGKLFMGRFDPSPVLPFPRQSAEDRDQGDAFLQRLETVLRDEVDPDAIDREGEIPDRVIDALARIGAFGIKVSRNYGGLGLSQTNYCRAAMVLGGYCGNLTALLSAHQSIGVAQPLILFGTEEQKRKFLPRVAGGEISAFALTEFSVGSDPARMETFAEPADGGRSFVLNGEKLWCTNGVKAGVIVVMARTPPKVIRGKPKPQVTAFIVEMDSPGVEVIQRCRFMGLKALYNGVIRFTDVQVPRENIILGEGKGLRVALTTLNTGRLTLPAACAGLAKRCLKISRTWASARVQWGKPIGRHGAIADKIARMAAHTFAMESMTLAVARRIDEDKRADIRLEAAMCKMWASERAWEIVNDTMQIRGGRGYETADSLKARGEPPIPVERFLRDSRINLIFEGSSEIMRLFLAREAMDPHLKIAGPLFNLKATLAQKFAAARRTLRFYSGWYPGLWLHPGPDIASEVDPVLRGHLRYVDRTARRLARSIFHAMVRYGPRLEQRQLLLARLMDIGTELFAIAATCGRVQGLTTQRPRNRFWVELADYGSRLARHRIQGLFRDLDASTDSKGYRIAQDILSGSRRELDPRLASPQFEKG